jgi:hypothetical protein
VVVDSAAVFLYCVFAADQRWSREHAEKIRKTLGPFPASAANRACESVKKIVQLSPENVNSEKSTSPKETNARDAELKKEFGHNIVFSAPRNLLEEVTNFSREDVGHDSLSEDESENDLFSRTLLEGMAQKKGGMLPWQLVTPPPTRASGWRGS